MNYLLSTIDVVVLTCTLRQIHQSESGGFTDTRGWYEEIDTDENEMRSGRLSDATLLNINSSKFLSISVNKFVILFNIFVLLLTYF